ncbi:FtsK/SpoIIIE domain-containing protein [Mycobacteroides chelonae]|uniref:FtsK/SpoIIIE domain-containing protein n=1 Tax=Mycobacteroides chelonae TaxID=1774 RepID=UPI0010423152|nr:FtsK/SpoIIIE domain-containing protein [Mycobacteroides chelonae]
MTGNNKHKRHARELQASQGGPYLRARRAVSRFHCPPITAVLGHGPDRRPVKLDFTRAYRGHVWVIAGLTGSGKTVLVASICRSLASSGNASEVSMLVGSEAPDVLFPSARVEDPRDVLRVISDEMAQRQALFRKASQELRVPIGDIESYRNAGFRMSTLVVVLDPFELVDPGLNGRVLTSMARSARALGLRVILTSQRDSLLQLGRGGRDLTHAVAAFVHLRGESRAFAGLEMGCGVVRSHASGLAAGSSKDDQFFMFTQLAGDPLQSGPSQ